MEGSNDPEPWEHSERAVLHWRRWPRLLVAMCSIGLGFALVLPFFVQAGRMVMLGLLPYGLIAAASAWPWDKAARPRFYATALALIGCLGVWIIWDGPYHNWDGIKLIMYWNFQCLVASAAVLARITQGIYRRRQGRKTSNPGN